MNLKIDNLTTEYLKNIYFELENESVIILGSNGAGKTTLAKAIVGLNETNKVHYNGIVVSKLSAKKRAELLNFIPSKLEVFDEHISVEEFLELSLFNGSIKKDIDTILEHLEIKHLKNSSCQSISSGESQLVLFASGLLQNSFLTIFDEPTANLDSDKKIKIFQLLQNHLGLKIVITHDLNLAFMLGFRVIFLQDGRLLFDGLCADFFGDENLFQLFGDSIKRVDNHFMVNYK